jgi:REP element-mobilizing transposase RayT
MVVGYHLIWTVYGWWLPNDPRGSSSYEIRVERIADLGELHYGRKQVQPRSAELRQFYDQARDLLQHPSPLFTPAEIELTGTSIAQVIAERRYTCYACAILPEHVHMLIRRHRDMGEEMILALQRTSRQTMIDAGHRSVTRPVWGGPGWKVFLYTREDMERIVKYIRNNPLKAGLQPQTWPFVKPYDGWLPAPAHHATSSAR